MKSIAKLDQRCKLFLNTVNATKRLLLLLVTGFLTIIIVISIGVFLSLFSVFSLFSLLSFSKLLVYISLVNYNSLSLISREQLIEYSGRISLFTYKEQYTLLGYSSCLLTRSGAFKYGSLFRLRKLIIRLSIGQQNRLFKYRLYGSYKLKGGRLILLYARFLV